MINKCEEKSPFSCGLYSSWLLGMLFYLFSVNELVSYFKQLGYNFTTYSIPVNIDYFKEITSYGSALSRVIFAWSTSRYNRKQAYDSFRKVLPSDMMDVQRRTTTIGIHHSSLAGTIDIIQRG